MGKAEWEQMIVSGNVFQLANYLAQANLNPLAVIVQRADGKFGIVIPEDLAHKPIQHDMLVLALETLRREGML